jgi:hypothetical protein
LRWKRSQVQQKMRRVQSLAVGYDIGEFRTPYPPCGREHGLF